MGGSFATDDQHSHLNLQPLRVASAKAGVYQEAKNLASELPGWEVVQADDERLVLTCLRKGGALSGTSTVTIKVEGPDGIPSSTVNVQSVSSGGLPGFARDKANVMEFMKLFHRRVC